MQLHQTGSKDGSGQDESFVRKLDALNATTGGIQFHNDSRIRWSEDSSSEPSINRPCSYNKGERNTEGAEEARALLICFAEGDSAAFWKLWENYQKYLYSVCLRQMGGNREEAEDALSRAMMKAWERLPFYAREVTNLKAWLTRLILNLCLDIHRERERRARGVQSLEEITGVNEGAAVCVFETPEEFVLRREVYLHISHAVDDLPPRLREPVILRFFKEMAYQDIAEHLTLSPANVRKRIQQARAILRGRLNRYFSDECDSPLEMAGHYKPLSINEEAIV